jgi:kynurenine 3-monooxygenase
LWKVLELPKQPDWEEAPPRRIRIQKRNFWSISAFGAYLPRHNGGWNALIFWQPKGNDDKINPCGIATPEQLQQLLHQMRSRSLPIPKLDLEKAKAFLAKRPAFEYWSQLNCYHDREGCVVAIGDAAHAMFSLFAQGCTAALGDAIALDTLLDRYNDDLKLVLPEFSNNQVAEGQAASNLSLITLVFFHPLFQLLYGIVTQLSTNWLKRPNIFVRINQINSNYTEVVGENKFWVWLGKRILEKNVKNSGLTQLD